MILCSSAAPAAAQPGDKAPEEAPADDSNAKVPAAPTAEQLAEAKAAFLKGRELFDAKDFEGAVKEFKESYRLSRNPLLLYNVGFTLDELKDKRMALFYYEKFLKDAPEDAAQRGEVAARAKTLRRDLEADSVFAGDSGTKKPPEEKPTKKPAKDATAEDFQHKVVDEAPPGKPLDLTCFVPEDSGWQVTLYYRAAGDDKFTAVGMRPRYNELVGRVPAPKMAGKSLQYYIEVKDRDTKLVTRSGRATSPQLVLIDAAAKPRYYPDLDDDRSYASADTGPAVGGGTEQPGLVLGDPNGGFMDVGSKKFGYAKWGATGATLGMLTLSVTFYLVAAQAQSSLEGEAAASTTQDSCPSGPPCRGYSDIQKQWETKGERYEKLTNITLGLGLVSAGIASYFWWKESKARKSAERAATAKAKGGHEFIAAPVVGDQFVGAAAAVRF